MAAGLPTTGAAASATAANENASLVAEDLQHIDYFLGRLARAGVCDDPKEQIIMGVLRMKVRKQLKPPGKET